MNAFHVSALSTVAVCVLALAGCAKHGGDEEAEQETPKALVAVSGVQIVSGDAVQSLTVTGRTDVLRRQRVISPVAGTISALNVLEGATVTPHQVLATILTRESQSAIAGAEALVRMARTPGQKAEAEQALELARSTENSVVVTAPWGGIVSSRSVNQGELVAENAELCTLVDLASVIFMAEVPLRDIPQIHAGMAARVHLTSLDGSDLPARVEALLPKADAQSQTALVRLRLDAGAATGLLRPDMGGTAGIVTGVHKNALLVPRSAVLRDDEKKTTSVVMVTPDSLALSVQVDVGAATDSVVEVRSGLLKPGMTVITEGNYAIADSTRVIVNARDQR